VREMVEQSVEEVATQEVLLRYIEENPGIRYRELLRLTGLVNGVLTYHLSGLEKSDAIKVDRKSRMTRYYPLSVSDKESVILKYVRHEPVRKILFFILENNMCTFNEIVEHTKKAPSTVSSHLKRMKEDGVLLVRYGECHLYSLADRELVYDVLSKYQSSLTDRIVDNYSEMVEEL
jgi:predicted transcriptional regulator